MQKIILDSGCIWASGEIEIKPLIIISGDFRNTIYNIFYSIKYYYPDKKCSMVSFTFDGRKNRQDTPIKPNECIVLRCPEAFLHPSEKVTYAQKLISALKENEGSVAIVAGFCPAMIECLLTTARRENFDENMSVYFAEKQGEPDARGRRETNYRDVTDDLEVVFSDLSYPIQKMYLEGLKTD